MADAVLAVSCNSHGGLAMGIYSSISFFKGAKSGMLLAESKEIAINNKLATYLISITDENQQSIASMQSTAYRKIVV